MVTYGGSQQIQAISSLNSSRKKKKKNCFPRSSKHSEPEFHGSQLSYMLPMKKSLWLGQEWRTTVSVAWLSHMPHAHELSVGRKMVSE